MTLSWDGELADQHPTAEERADRAPHATIARRIVALHKARRGRGPTTVRVRQDGDLLVVDLRGGALTVEQTLAAGGHAEAVARQRAEYESMLRAELAEIVEAATGRTVAAFMSASHAAPDIAVEIFLLGDERDA